MGVETGFSEGAVSSALIRCHLPRVSVQRPSTVYSQFPKTSRIRVIGNLTDKLFSDLHGYCLLEQKSLLISCGNCALIFYRIFETISMKPKTEAMNKWFVDYVNRYKGF